MINRNLRIYGVSAALVVLAAIFLYLLRSVVVPFLLALVLAYFLNPAVAYLESRRLSRSAAVCLVFALFLLAAGALLAFLIPSIKQEFLHIQAALPDYAESLYRLVPNALLEWLGIAGGEEMQTLFSRLLAGVRSLSSDVVNQVAIFLSRAFASTFSFLLAVLGYFIIPLYLFYLLRDYDRIKGMVLGSIPPRHRSRLAAVGVEIDGVLAGFIRGQLTVCAILAVLYSVGLAVIGIDLALVIGILSGIAFIIPYLGTIFGIVAAGIMAVVKFHDLLHPALVIGWFALVQLLEGTVITPRIVGERVGLHPLGTILAVLAGGELFGFLGLLLAVPVAASGTVIGRYLVEHYRRSAFYTETGEGEGADA